VAAKNAAPTNPASVNPLAAGCATRATRKPGHASTVVTSTTKAMLISARSTGLLMKRAAATNTGPEPSTPINTPTTIRRNAEALGIAPTCLMSYTTVRQARGREPWIEGCGS